jgi:hypothetical protein
MVPNKLENQIKEKLNARKIEPSEPSWNKLETLLSASEDKKAKKSYAWFFAAASIVLFFGIGIYFFTTNTTSETQNQVPEVVATNKVVDSVETNTTEEVSVKNQPILVQTKIKKIRIQINEGKSLVSDEKQLPSPYSLLPASSSQHPASSSYKYITPETLLTEVQTGEKVNPSDKKIISKPKIKVDANSLLSTVEKELDDTHRETTLDKLTRKFNDAKSALANRNYE